MIFRGKSGVSSGAPKGTPMRASTMPSPEPLAQKNNLMKIIDRWPVALIGFGLMLTLVWGAFLIWFPLRLLDLV